MNEDFTKPGSRLSRRSFIKGAGATAVVAGIGSIKRAASAPVSIEAPTELGDGIAEKLGPGPITLELSINGAARQITVEPRLTMLEVLRDHLGFYGTKSVCGRGACGACTVHFDGAPVVSCMVLVTDARGHQVTTIEGLTSGVGMHPVQQAFVENDALQCGFCTPGMIMSVAAALKSNPNASLEDVKQAVSGNVCRCGTYPHVFNAALAAARQLRNTSEPKA